MNATATVPNPDVPEVEPVGNGLGELESVLASPAFKKAPTLSRLLTYLWEQRNNEVNEYAIATEGLGRRADFEPRTDATVRVLVSRLRLRLKEFYELDGADLPARIVIPIGSHQIQVVEEPRPSLEPSGDDESDRELPPRILRRQARSRKIVFAQGICIGVLLLTSLWLFLDRNRAVNDAAQGRARMLPVFWREFLGNGRHTRIVVPTPVLFGWGTGVIARDVNVNQFAKLEDSPSLRTLVREWGKPNLAQQYVSASDALASLHLAQYLDPSGMQLTISTTADSPADTLERENLIVAGTPRTLAPFQAALDRLSFQVDADKGEVFERVQASNPTRRFATVQQSALRMATPGIIACLPGRAQGTKILIFVTTYYTSALVSYLTSENGLSELRAAQRTHRNSPYFEAVIVSEINGSTDLGSHLVEFRPIAAGK